MLCGRLRRVEKVIPGMDIQCFLVNSFTDQLACGNPAGVIISESNLSDELMQSIAVDIGKSETAFINRTINNTFNIRWFTPIKEINLCGHASLAASKVVNHIYKIEKIEFKYMDGYLNSEIDGNGNISIEFPLDSYAHIDVDERFYEFFGEMPILDCIRGKSTKKVVIIVEDDFDLTDIKPNYELMKREHGIFEHGIGISKQSNQYDCETRYFNPWFGVNEDPVTGSVHTVLARYIQDMTGRTIIRAYQSSNRPGEILLKINGDKVDLNGKAKIVLEGKIDI